MKRIVPALLMFALLLLSACGGSDSEDADAGTDDSERSASTADQFNEADVRFAQSMIPHHEQAVEMADMAMTNAGSPEVKTLAGEIKAAQRPEIETMTAWLEAWGEKRPGGSDDVDGHDMETGSEGADMAPEQMSELEAASGPAFDRAFLEMMIEHHQGAIDMSMTELEEGENADALKLATEIVKAQEAEITRMKALLADAP